MPQVSSEQWEAFARQRADLHFLQTREWGELKSRFGWEPVWLLRQDLGAQILFRKLPLGLSVAYIPRGDALLAAGAASALWPEIDALCRERRSVFCKLEIDSWEPAGVDHLNELRHSQRFGQSGPSIQPRRTITVDLRQSEDEILARMKPKCRYNIRLAARKGVTVSTSADIQVLYRLIESTGRRDGFSWHPQAYYRNAYESFHSAESGELFVAHFDSTPLAAILVVRRGRRAWYVYGGSADVERDRMPAYAIQWAAMCWAKERGCEEYDLWGVPDLNRSELEASFERRHDGLWGVYRFKRGFGGEVRRSPAALDRIYQPLLYKLYLKRAIASVSP